MGLNCFSLVVVVVELRVCLESLDEIMEMRDNEEEEKCDEGSGYSCYH